MRSINFIIYHFFQKKQKKKTDRDNSATSSFVQKLNVDIARDVVSFPGRESQVMTREVGRIPSCQDFTR